MNTATLRRAGLVVVFLWFFGGGIGHFVLADFFIGIVPPYIPRPDLAVFVSGVFEILLALALIPLATRLWAGRGLILLTLAVTPANVHMWLHPDQFPEMPYWALTLRLLIQVLLLACIWWSTRPVATTR
jgi:uncharacterized membrane protein